MKTNVTTKQLKATARELLKTNWKNSVGIISFTLLISLLYLTINLTSRNPIFVSLSYVYPVLNNILQVGILSFFLKIACGYGYKSTTNDIFYGFKHKPGSIILIYLLFILYFMPLAILAVITTITGMIFAYANLTFSFIITITLAVILAIIYSIYISLTYGLVYFLFLDYPDMPVFDLMKRSKSIMVSHRLRLLYLELSFIPLQLLAILSFQIGSLWVTPYMLTAKSLFYLNLIQTPVNIKREENL